MLPHTDDRGGSWTLNMSLSWVVCAQPATKGVRARGPGYEEQVVYRERYSLAQNKDVLNIQIELPGDHGCCFHGDRGGVQLADPDG